MLTDTHIKEQRGPYKNLIGNRFGRLVVLSIDSKHNQFYKYLCRCDCGNLAIVYGHGLGRKTNSCGCLLNEMYSSMDKKVVGKTFGKLKVVKFSHSDGAGRKYYCECDCGKSMYALGSRLLAKVTKHCGCNSYPYEDLTGKKFGSWIVLYESIIQKQRRTWRCKCICDMEKDVMEFSLKNGHSKSCGCNTQYESFMAIDLKKYFIRYYKGIPEYRVCKNPKTNYYLRCDIYLPETKTYIEVNGEQHYRPTNSFHKNNANSFLYRKSLDDLKKYYAQKHGTYIEIDLRKIRKVKEAIFYIEQRL